MMERTRVVLVAAPAAPIRDLAAHLHDPDVDVVLCGSAREALEQIEAARPAAVVLDGSLLSRDVTFLAAWLGAAPVGAGVPVIFSNHDAADPGDAARSDSELRLGPDATLDDLEQLLYTFLPAPLPSVGDETDEEPRSSPALDARLSPAQLSGPASRLHSRPRTPPSTPREPTIGFDLHAGSTRMVLAYLGAYGVIEAVAASLDARLGLLGHAGLLLAILFHGANVPPGPTRTFLWALWLAPITRIYGLAQPYAGVQPATWLALTAVPTAIAGLVAMRLAGLTARESSLIPKPREVPLAVVMVPVGLALGVLTFLLLAPNTLGQEFPDGGIGLLALIVIVNPGTVDELLFRGILQRATVGLYGTRLGVLYGSLLYAPVLPAGLTSSGSLTTLAVTFATAALLALLTARTGSVLPAIVAHAGLALGLLVIAPAVLPGGLAPTAGAPATPPTLDLHPTPTRPAVIVAPGSPSPQPGSTAQPSGPAQAAPPGQAAQPGPSGPPLLATPITLATPLTSSVAPAAPPSGPGTAPGLNQIVVVRGTGGSGARLRAQPGSNGAIMTVIPEYTPLVVIGPDRVVDGIAWRNVRAPNGSEGWIAASFVTTS